MADDPLLLPTVSHFYLKIMSLDPLPLYFSINENLTDGSRWCIVDKYWISTLRLLLHGHFIFQNVAHFHEKISKPSVLFVCWCGKKIHMKIKVLVPCGTKCQSINHWNQYLLVCFREWQFKVHKKSWFNEQQMSRDSILRGFRRNSHFFQVMTALNFHYEGRRKNCHSITCWKIDRKNDFLMLCVLKTEEEKETCNNQFFRSSSIC